MISREDGSTGLILAAGGSGTRIGGGSPKQFRELRGRPLYVHSLEAFRGSVDRAVVVVPEAYLSAVRRQLADLAPAGAETLVVRGGGSRQASVRKGLDALDESVEFVLVHDAARPSVSPALIRRVLDATIRWGASVPVVPVPDTVKEIREQMVVRTIPREGLGLAQTPQGVRRKLLREALEKAERAGFEATDESLLLEWCGFEVRVVEGEIVNSKITWPEDLERLDRGV